MTTSNLFFMYIVAFILALSLIGLIAKKYISNQGSKLRKRDIAIDEINAQYEKLKSSAARLDDL